MKQFAILLTLLCLGLTLPAQNGRITGQITDEKGEPLVGANVYFKEAGAGSSTDADGRYDIRITPGAYTLIATYTGYADLQKSVTVTDGGQLSVDFELQPGTTLDEIVVSGSKKPEKLTESPATIETIFAREIQEYAGSPAELLARQKGVEYFRAGVAGPGINIRGYNSNFNSKNLQVTDGRLSTLIATGLPFGPLNTSVKDDIERIEVILGPNATLYGPNAHNGLVNIITKDPRRSAGTTIALNAGNQSALGARIRHAQVLSDKVAFKVMAEYSKAEEFAWSDSVYIDRAGAFDDQGNPKPNGVKEGYNEYQLDNSINFLRTEAALYLTPFKKGDFILNWGRSNSNFLSPTNVGRNQIKDWQINYYQLRFNSDHFFAQVNYTTSATDSTYSIDERTKQYYRGIDAGLSPAVAGGDFSYGSGALFQDDSRRLAAEAQYNTDLGPFELIIGAQYQKDMAGSLGSYLLDNMGFINVSQMGGYAHLTYKFGNGWRLLAAGRADDHEIYGFNFVPKFGILKVGDSGTFRLTYGKGIAAPTILNMYGNLFAGLILGNAEGFTLADGRTVEKQKVEKLQTIEAGYRGQVVKDKFFIDANAYYNISEDFLSPLKVLGVATLRGNTPVKDLQSGYAIYNGLVASYVNFGKFNTYGFDLGATYYFTPQINAYLNYSYFGYSIDENNLENDFDGNGVVNFLDLLVNAPNHKFGLGVNYSGDKFFGSVFTRWVQAYDYFSSFQIASRTHPGLSYRGVPIVENARSADTFNYGPLGGFTTVDLNLGYRLSKIFTVSAAVTNLFDTEMREFTACPPTGRLFGVELTVNLPAIKPKK
ncbi:MAG: TonB-dependent receptor [Lewinellaceae bacterium]|nr:TonB-dependent receptor [Lewinella sp.]MCB9280056.1 TonB-dependent receptor [Lewinellaceae bacterium]